MSAVAEEPEEESKVNESVFNNITQMSTYNLVTGKTEFIAKNLTEPGSAINAETMGARLNYF